MKALKFIPILLFLNCLFFAGCKKDTYAPPQSVLTGSLQYKGSAIGVAYNEVTFQLWQSGFGKLSPINVTTKQNGNFSALLFDGDYKLIFPQGQGPFIINNDGTTKNDTIFFTLNKEINLDIEVLPYYIISNFNVNNVDKTVTATLGLERILDDSRAKNISKVSLYISKTNFVDGRTSIATKSINGNTISDLNNISLSTTIPDMIPSQNYVFARVGVKIESIEDELFSEIIEIDF